MKIAVSAIRPCIDAPMNRRFESSRFFVIVDQQAEVESPVRVPRRLSRSTRGGRLVRLLVEHGVSTVLAGSCEPGTLDHLDAEGIRVITGCSGSVRRELERLRIDLGWSALTRPVPLPMKEPDPVEAETKSREMVGGGGRSRRGRDREPMVIEHSRSVSWRLGGFCGI